MAQTAEYYRDQILAQVEADSLLAPLVDDTSSAFEFIRRIAYAIGYVAAIIDKLMDTLRSNIDADLAALLPHQLNWYVTKAKQFIYGLTLPMYSDTYDPADVAALSPTDLANDMVIKFAAATEDATGTVYMKVATLDGGGNRVPVDSSPFNSFQTYMKRVKDAGVKIVFINATGDLIQVVATLYYDPEIMTANGALISDGSYPATIALNNYLNNLPFNGEISVPAIEDALQAATGITLAQVTAVNVKPVTALAFTAVAVRNTPYSGYYNIDTFTATFIAEP